MPPRAGMPPMGPPKPPCDPPPKPSGPRDMAVQGNRPTRVRLNKEHKNNRAHDFMTASNYGLTVCWPARGMMSIFVADGDGVKVKKESLSRGLSFQSTSMAS